MVTRQAFVRSEGPSGSGYGRQRTCTDLLALQGAPLALRGSTAGSPTALVVSWGNTLTITPVCHDTVDDTAQRTLPFGGADVTAFLGRLVEQERGVTLGSDDRAALRRFNIAT